MTTTYTITDTVTGETKPLHLLSQKEMDALFKTWAEVLREKEVPPTTSVKPTRPSQSQSNTHPQCSYRVGCTCGACSLSNPTCRQEVGCTCGCMLPR